MNKKELIKLSHKEIKDLLRITNIDESLAKRLRTRLPKSKRKPFKRFILKWNRDDGGEFEMIYHIMKELQQRGFYEKAKGLELRTKPLMDKLQKAIDDHCKVQWI